VTVTVQYISKQ